MFVGVLTEEQKRRRQHPIDGDLITMDILVTWLQSCKMQNGANERPIMYRQMGCVESMSVRPITDAMNFFQTYPQLSE